MSLYNCNTTQFANEFMNIEIYLHVPLLTDLIQITWSNLLGFFNSIYILRFYVIFFSFNSDVPSIGKCQWVISAQV